MSRFVEGQDRQEVTPLPECLEHERQRHVELMWSTGRLAPDFKTIADAALLDTT